MINNNLSIILGGKLLKVSDIHEDTGISRTTLTDFYYKRSKDVRLSTLIKICDYLQITLSDLIEYDPKRLEEENNGGTTSSSC